MINCFKHLISGKITLEINFKNVPCKVELLEDLFKELKVKFEEDHDGNVSQLDCFIS